MAMYGKLIIVNVLMLLTFGSSQAYGSVSQSLSITSFSSLPHIVVEIGTALALVSFNVLLMYLGKKFKLDGILSNRQLIQKAAIDAISYAEEKAMEYAKDRNNEGRNRMTSNDKLNLAVSRLLNDVPKIDRQKARDSIESVIGQLKGVGSTGDKTIGGMK